MSIIEADPPVAKNAADEVREVVVENGGAIERVSIPIPRGGGVTVLKGRNGTGKSTAINGLRSLGSQKGGDVPVRDGELQARVYGLGAKLTIGKRCNHSGELEVSMMDGVDPGKIVDPGLKDQEANDAKRMHELIRMSGQPADPAIFYDLVGGKAAFEALLPGIAIDEDDLLKLAGKVKRGLEAKARESESLADQERGKALGAHEAAAGVDLDGESDENKLGSELEQAIAAKAALDTKVQAATAAANTAKTAREFLETARASAATLPSYDEAKARETSALKAHEAADDLVEKLKADLKSAENAAETAATEWHNASAARASAENRGNAMRGWEKSIAAGDVPCPSDAEIQAAAQRVANARSAVETGALIRRARQHLATEEQHKRNAQAHAEDEKGLRNAARGIDDALSALVVKCGTPLRFEGGRLILTTSRGKTYFSDLSHGERTTLVVNACMECAGEDGLLPLDQEYWESLDPTNRRSVQRLSVQKKVNVVTAEATDDERITAEVMKA